MLTMLIDAASKRRVAFPSSLDEFTSRLAEWLERSRTRRALHRLDDRMLKDIGLSRIDVLRECTKPFWRP